MHLFADGFDYYAFADRLLVWSAEWGGGQNLSFSAGTGRRGTSAFKGLSISRGLEKVLAPGDATCLAHLAYKPAGLEAQQLLQIADASVTHLSFETTAAGALEVRRGAAGAVLGTAPGLFTVGVFTHLQIKATIHDTTGVVELYVNGSAVASLNLTAQDTRNGGTAGWTTIRISPGNGQIDDVVIADGTGTTCNTLYGDARVDIRSPDANGTSSGSTPSAGVDRYATVDEIPPSAADYNTLAAVGSKDTLNMQNVPAAGLTIKAVEQHVLALKTDAGACELAVVMRSGAVDTDGPSVALSTTAMWVKRIHTVDPATGVAWTDAGYDAHETGYKRTV